VGSEEGGAVDGGGGGGGGRDISGAGDGSDDRNWGSETEEGTEGSAVGTMGGGRSGRSGGRVGAIEGTGASLAELLGSTMSFVGVSVKNNEQQ